MWTSLLQLALYSLLLVVLAVEGPSVPKIWKDILEYGVVVGFSGLVAYGELLGRYKDDPRRLLAGGPTRWYILVNIAAGVAAILIVRYMDVFKGNSHPRLYEILLAGFGAVAFFRTSLFVARIGETDVPIGPNALLQALLNAADRMIDRGQAEGRAQNVAEIMQSVDFNKAQAALPTLCFTLVQNIADQEQTDAAKQIKTVADAESIAEPAKAIILGVYLIRLVGADVLERSVQALGSTIKRSPG